MDALTAVNIGIECGMKTVGEAVLNITIHDMNWFPYDAIENEESELFMDVEANNLQPHTDIYEAQKLLRDKSESNCDHEWEPLLEDNSLVACLKCGKVIEY
jgi:hypothetical protein